MITFDEKLAAIRNIVSRDAARLLQLVHLMALASEYLDPDASDEDRDAVLAEILDFDQGRLDRARAELGPALKQVNAALAVGREAAPGAGST